MDKQTMLEELDDILIMADSKGRFPTDLSQLRRFFEVLKGIIERLPDDPAEDAPAESDDQK